MFCADLPTSVPDRDPQGLKHVAVLNKDSTTAALLLQSGRD